MKKSRTFPSTSAFAGILITLTIMATFNVGCQKENLTKGPSWESDAEKPLASSCGDPLPANTVLGLMENPDDPADTRINLIMYHYAQAIRAAAQNPTLLCYMEEAMLDDADSAGVSVLALAQNSASFAQAVNTALRNSVNAHNIYPRGVEPGIDALRSDPDWDANSYLKARTEYAPYAYHPVIYFTKRPSGCDGQRLPTVAIAHDVDDCDDVAGWRGNAEAIIGETEADTTSETIIFVGPGRAVYTLDQAAGGPPSANIVHDPVVSERSVIDVDVDRRQVKAGFRFESSARSEIRGWAIISNQTNTTDKKVEFDLGKIHKDDIAISKIFEDDKNAFVISPSEYINWTMFLGTYEYDWFASKKTIANECAPFPANMKMKFSHEFYFKACGNQVLGPLVGNQFPFFKTFANDKCMFKFKVDSI